MRCANCRTELAENSRYCSVCGIDQESPDSSPKTSGSGTALMARLAEVLQGRYRITKMAGRGGMAAVFLAEDLTLERPVAVKVLPPEVSHDERLVGRFEREARTAAKLDHPNIIPIYAVEHSDDLYYFVMKYVDGESLDQLLKKGRVPLERAVDFLWESARALGHAHHRGVIHRDVKPANILIDHDGRTILTDFGIAKAVQAATQFTGTGQVIGTPHYMSPEQAKGGEVDGRADQYSLGVVGFQMITGRLPFGDDSIHAVIYKHVSEKPPLIQDLNPDCPPYLATAVHRALQKKPEDRFPTMEAFAQAICPDRRLSVPTTAGAGGSAMTNVSSAPTEVSQTTITAESVGRRSRFSKVAAVFLLLAGLGAGGYWGWSAGLLAALGVPGPAGATQGLQDGGTTLDTLMVDPEGAVLAALSDTGSASRSDRPTDGESSDGQPVETTEDDPDPVRPTPVGDRGSDAQAAPLIPEVRTGYLSVRTDPFGRLYIDDVYLQETPAFEHELPAGRYIIKVINDACQTYVDTIVVEAGDETTVIRTLICG